MVHWITVYDAFHRTQPRRTKIRPPQCSKPSSFWGLNNFACEFFFINNIEDLKGFMRRDRISFQDVIQYVAEKANSLPNHFIFLWIKFHIQSENFLGSVPKCFIKIEESMNFTSFHIEISTLSKNRRKRQNTHHSWTNEKLGIRLHVP